MSVQLVDPTLGTEEGILPRALRPSSLDGLTIGLINNGKAHGREILERVAHNLAERHQIAGTRYLRKKAVNVPPEPADIDSFAEQCGAIVSAIGD